MSPHTNPSRVIRSQVVLEEHDVAPHGRFAVVVRRSVAGKEYRSHLWLIPLEGKDKGTGSGKGKPTRLTTGAVRDSYPRIAPDGRSIAFRRATPKGEGRVMVLALRSDGTPGKLRALNTPAKRAVSALAWSPDSKRLALAMEEDRLRFIVGGEPPKGEEPLAVVGIVFGTDQQQRGAVQQADGNEPSPGPGVIGGQGEHLFLRSEGDLAELRTRAEGTRERHVELVGFEQVEQGGDVLMPHPQLHVRKTPVK